MCTVNILLLESSIISRLSGTTHADTPNSRRTDPAQKVFVLMKLLAMKTLTIRLCDYIMQWSIISCNDYIMHVNSLLYMNNQLCAWTFQNTCVHADADVHNGSNIYGCIYLSIYLSIYLPTVPIYLYTYLLYLSTYLLQVSISTCIFTDFIDIDGWIHNL